MNYSRQIAWFLILAVTSAIGPSVSAQGGAHTEGSHRMFSPGDLKWVPGRDGFMAAKYLFIASEVGLFERVAEGPATFGEFAQRLSIPRRTTRIIANAMVA